MISYHTKLMNCFIGFTKNDTCHPCILRNLGYNVDSIEPNFRNKDNEKVNPDLLLTSRKVHHSMIVECKGGNQLHSHDEEQKKGYDKVEKTDFINITSTTEPDKLNFDITFAMGNKISDNINTFTFMDNRHPIILHKDSKMILSNNHGRFKITDLNNLFSAGISLDNKIPTNYYPFGYDDPIEYIAIKVLRSIAYLAGKKKSEVTLDDIMKTSHPLWDRFDDSYKAKVKEKVKKIMDSKSFNKIKEFITKNKDKYRINTRALQSLQETCQKIIEDLQNQEKQKKLFE